MWVLLRHYEGDCDELMDIVKECYSDSGSADSNAAYITQLKTDGSTYTDKKAKQHHLDENKDSAIRIAGIVFGGLVR